MIRFYRFVYKPSTTTIQVLLEIMEPLSLKQFAFNCATINRIEVTVTNIDYKELSKGFINVYFINYNKSIIKFKTMVKFIINTYDKLPLYKHLDISFFGVRFINECLKKNLNSLKCYNVVRFILSMINVCYIQKHWYCKSQISIKTFDVTLDKKCQCGNPNRLDVDFLENKRLNYIKHYISKNNIQYNNRKKNCYVIKAEIVGFIDDEDSYETMMMCNSTFETNNCNFVDSYYINDRGKSFRKMDEKKLKNPTKCDQMFTHKTDCCQRLKLVHYTTKDWPRIFKRYIVNKYFYCKTCYRPMYNINSIKNKIDRSKVNIFCHTCLLKT
ncbi:diguanylate kinase signaling-like protein [Hemileuca sp. nucleopolyhedrovirus]|uniref:Diguanylate kinase signaling-like protein n=1 Tax=Hemileuca sp. nucleopolyhedrovirus TaxID=1367203 RepID=S5N938_9ABAC|nr:diguanylate kinase signaling-like protein [Hemileuca sp. nucleopolyhedrovirus]AGR56757.1 diguanylate kinase signaling-like protein [Hemileuca sp. nucleopolyhedrovirus]